MGKNNKIPDRWLPYSPMGSIVPGTRFIACKVPLKDQLLKDLPEKERFGPKNLMEAFPKIGLLVDLTNTDRYYVKQEFMDNNIQYEKIYCPGRVIPPNSIIKQFFRVVDDYLTSVKDPDAVIVVHCTHGVNRTGYFICRYMIERLNISPEEAVKKFQIARGHDIERMNYVDDLKGGCKGGKESDLRFLPSSGCNNSHIQSRARHGKEFRGPRQNDKTHRRKGYDNKQRGNDNDRGVKRQFNNQYSRHQQFDDSGRGRPWWQGQGDLSYNWRDSPGGPPPASSSSHPAAQRSHPPDTCNMSEDRSYRHQAAPAPAGRGSRRGRGGGRPWWQADQSQSYNWRNPPAGPPPATHTASVPAEHPAPPADTSNINIPYRHPPAYTKRGRGGGQHKARRLQS